MLAAPCLAIVVIVAAVPFAWAAGRAIVSNEKGGTLTVVDTGANKVTASVPVCGRPRYMAWTLDRAQIMVACGDDGVIRFVDGQTLQATRTISGITGVEAFDTDPGQTTLFASNEGTAGLSVVDLATGKVVGRVEVGEEPEGVLYLPVRKEVWVASEATDLVHVIDPGKRQVVADLMTGSRPRRVKLAPDGQQVWVSCEMAGTVEVWDPETRTRTAEITFAPKGIRRDQIMPVDLVFSSDGATAWVSLGRANQVAAVDARTREVQAYVQVGERPWGLALSPDGQRLYVANGLSDDITVVDTAARKPVVSIAVGKVPYGVLMAE